MAKRILVILILILSFTAPSVAALVADKEDSLALDFLQQVFSYQGKPAAKRDNMPEALDLMLILFVEANSFKEALKQVALNRPPQGNTVEVFFTDNQVVRKLSCIVDLRTQHVKWGTQIDQLLNIKLANYAKSAVDARVLTFLIALSHNFFQEYGAESLSSLRVANQRRLDVQFSVFRSLMLHGLSINVRDAQGRTILMAACADGNGVPEDIYFLVRLGANVNAQDNEGNTAAWFALGHSFFPGLYGKSYINPTMKTRLEVLNENGADLTLRNSYGQTVLDYANTILIHTKDREPDLALLAEITDIIKKNQEGQATKDLGIIKALLVKSKDLQARTKELIDTLS